LDGPAIAGDEGIKGSKKEGPGHFMVNFTWLGFGWTDYSWWRHL